MISDLNIDECQALLALCRKGLASLSNEADVTILHRCTGAMLRFAQLADEAIAKAKAATEPEAAIEKAAP